MVDPRAGATIAATGLPSTFANHPAWSPDGALIAYIASNSQWPSGFTQGDLMVLPQTSPDAFGAPSMLHHGTALDTMPEGPGADLHPTWSPDGRWIAFAHGASDTFIATTGALYAMPSAGGTPVRLATAMRGTSNQDSYWPTFSPFIASETDASRMYWLAFYDRRDYGNALAGTAGSRRRQLWVTAVDAQALGAGNDGSHVPYWLPAQDTQRDNLAAYWAPTPCRANGAACGVSGECCSAQCLTDQSGGFTCQPPPPAECRPLGQTCGGSADCCSMLQCYRNVCLPPTPG
jgi:hypothetical protein